MILSMLVDHITKAHNLTIDMVERDLSGRNFIDRNLALSERGNKIRIFQLGKFHSLPTRSFSHWKQGPDELFLFALYVCLAHHNDDVRDGNRVITFIYVCACHTSRNVVCIFFLTLSLDVMCKPCNVIKRKEKKLSANT